MNIDTHTKPSNKIIRTTTVTIFLMVTSRVSPTFFFPALNWTLRLIKYLHSFNLQGHWQHLIIIERERERETIPNILSYLTKTTTETMTATESPTLPMKVKTPFRCPYCKSFTSKLNMQTMKFHERMKTK